MPKALNLATLLLVIVGALNWLLVGLFEFDLVATIGGLDFGETNWFTRIVYILVGVSGLAQLLNLGQIATREE
jgi:uncharacterized membrane protein YuzA (DUF378 family)